MGASKTWGEFWINLFALQDNFVPLVTKHTPREIYIKFPETALAWAE